MARVVKIVVENALPEQPREHRSKTVLLVLIMFDTMAVAKIVRDSGYEYYLPAKYALIRTEGGDDRGMIAQYLAKAETNHEGVWFNELEDLPEAMSRLRTRHSDLPEQVSAAFDWPFSRKRTGRGYSIVNFDLDHAR